jgi:hypothetical protein
MPIFALSIYVDMPIMLVAIALVYSATRHDHWPRIFSEALRWILQIVLFLGGLGVILGVLSKWW